MANALRWAAVPDCTLRTNYTAGQTFTDSLASTTIGLAFDGTNFWSITGGNTGGNRLARYTSAGVFVAAYAPGIDFRSLFTDAGGILYARGFSSLNILRQTTPGVFVTNVVLTGAVLASQASVVLNGNGDEYLALNSGVVSRWSTNGSFLGTVTLVGFGAVAGENSSPQNTRLAVAGQNWLTYHTDRTLSVWSTDGQRVATTTLTGAGTTATSAYSLSHAAGKAWIIDADSSIWRSFTKTRMIAIFTSIARSLFKTLDSIATPRSVKAYGR